MSHLAIALIIVLSISIIITLLIIMHNKQLKARKNSMLSFFKHTGTTYNLSFTGQEILRAMIIGLDGPKRKLLIAEEKNEEYNTRIIDLDEVVACKVKKVYAAINSHEYKKNRPEEYLKSISVEFELVNSETPALAFFYKYKFQFRMIMKRRFKIRFISFNNGYITVNKIGNFSL